MQPFYLKYSLFNKSFINLAKIILVMKRIVLFVVSFILLSWACLLYTSDAADDLLCVDLGGRRIIKKKK